VSVSQMMGRCRTGERAKNRQKAKRILFSRGALSSRAFERFGGAQRNHMSFA